jgi:SAM-dependent methyltransferase
MKKLIKSYINRFSENVAGRVVNKGAEDEAFMSNIAYRVAAETVLNNTTLGKNPNEIFGGLSDEFWYWLNTEGVRRNAKLRSLLPGMPDGSIQELYTGNKGDTTLWEAFLYYRTFKEQYAKYKGDLSSAEKILDFGCGWGRVIRFFLKDLEPSRIWGSDPVPEMIELCKQHNSWCNFQETNTYPPTSFADNSFDLIYSFSVFSHLAEHFHLNILSEILRILKPGGIYMTTTRNRGFIEYCESLRQRKDKNSLEPGNSSSLPAFPDTRKSLSIYDNGEFCHHSFNSEVWPYWGETAISRKYVLNNWTNKFKFLDFLEVNTQNVIIVQKPI